MIRRAREQDTDDILRLLTQVWAVHHAGRPDLFAGAPTKYTKEELHTLYTDEQKPIFVYEKDGHVVGYAFCVFEQHSQESIFGNIKTLYIDDICVDKEARNNHIGTALYNHVKVFAKEAGAYNITLNVWTCNPGAQHFYEKCGLKPQKICMEEIL